MRRLRYRASATQDLTDIAAWLLAHDAPPKSVRKALAGLRRACRRLAERDPVMGRPRDDLRQGLRSMPLKPHLIYFTYPDEHTVEIIRVLHGARDIEAIFARETDATNSEEP